MKELFRTEGKENRKIPLAVRMSPEKIDATYRMYGASDRTDSNDYTGCMGLGSKTPFCYYTKTFTVDSWYNGIHYTYACFLNEDGMPQISLMSKEPSNEHVSILKAPWKRIYTTNYDDLIEMSARKNEEFDSFHLIAPSCC